MKYDYVSFANCDQSVIESLPSGMQFMSDVVIGPIGHKLVFPEDMTINGDIHVAHASSVKEVRMPNKLTLKGGTITEIDKLLDKIDRMPDGVVLSQGITLTEIERLPENLKVDGVLEIVDNDLIRSLPNGLKVFDTLEINNCKNLENLPKDLSVDELRIYSCPKITEIHESRLNLMINSGLFVDSCRNLVTIKTDRALCLWGVLYVRLCSSLKELPIIDDDTCNFTVISCGNLEELPKFLDVKSIRIELCDNLVVFPMRMKARTEINIQECHFFKNLECELVSTEYFRLRNCDSIERITVDMLPCDNIEISNCMNLQAIDANISAKELRVESCDSLTELPDKGEVENLVLTNCASLAKIPESLDITGFIHCHNTSINVDDVPLKHRYKLR